MPQLLSDCDRPIRRDLRTWACDITTSLLDAARPAEGIFASLNQAALVFTHLGDLASAEDICRRELEWVAARARHDRSLTGLALQPWVNIGRLRLLQADPELALRHFVFDLAQHETHLGPVTVRRDDWDLLGRIHPGALDALHDACLYDAITALLALEDNGRVFTFLEAHDRAFGVPRLQSLLYEATLLGWTRLSAYDSVLRLEVPPSIGVYGGSVACFYRALGLAEMGQHEAALGLTARLIGSLLRPEVSSVRPATLLRYLDKLTCLAERLGRNDQWARGLAQRGLALSILHGDQVGQYRFLKYLTNPSCPDDLSVELRQLLAASDYASIGPDRMITRRETAVMQTYQRLADAVSCALSST
jgi:hypothetical protein